jgi:hypothetical protein
VSQTKTYLYKFGKYVVQQSKSNLTKKRKKDRGELYNSVSYELTVSKNSFQLSFKMTDYGEFVDKGVKGVSSSFKAPKSPFKFGTGSGAKGGLTNGIDGWVQRKRIQFKNRSNGQFMSYKQTSFLIRNSIWNKGIETTNFFTKPFEEAFKRLPEDLVEAYALEVEDLLKYTLK